MGSLPAVGRRQRQERRARPRAAAPDARHLTRTEGALDGTDHLSHQQHASMIRRYIIWRNSHAYDQRLRRIVDRANVA
ncbi:MAG TPA: hypothetical protein VIV12_21450 [Streptosporangiaceae bacterium]